MNLCLVPTSPYDFDLTMRIHNVHPGEVVDNYVNCVYRRVLNAEEEHVLVSVKSIGTVDEPELRVSVHTSIPSKLEEEVRRKLEHMLSTDADLQGFYSAISKDRVLTQIANELYGLRATRTESLFEALVIAITEQQISLKAAVAIRGRIARRCGNRVVLRGREYYSFPSERSMTRARIQHLRDSGLSGKKVEYIVGLSREAASGRLDLEKMIGLPTEEIISELTKIRGVGRWTAEYAVARGLGRFDALPADDAALRRAVSALYYGEREVTGEEVRRLLDKYGQYKGYAAFYLLGLELLGCESLTNGLRYR